jgi:hypothetical protein
MYKLTIFSKRGKVVDEIISPEYPETPPLKPGQWIDICRLPVSDNIILEHLLEELELDFCSIA